MEIAEAHRKVHNELEENVSRFKFNFQFEYEQLKQMRCNYNPLYWLCSWNLATKTKCVVLLKVMKTALMRQADILNVQ